jgi:hypothetical protein
MMAKGAIRYVLPRTRVVAVLPSKEIRRRTCSRLTATTSSPVTGLRAIPVIFTRFGTSQAIRSHSPALATDAAGGIGLASLVSLKC